MKNTDKLVLQTDESKEYYLEEGCFILEYSNSEIDPDLSIARARLPKGHSTKWHYLLDTTERYVILSGEGAVELGDAERKTMRAGDVAVIPPMMAQRIHNTGTGDLVFLCMCSPRFLPENYKDGRPE